jgi:Protein of unknown function (DUF3604)
MAYFAAALLTVVCGLNLGTTVIAADAPQRTLLWGEQHVHTSWSFDAFAFGNQFTGPEDFYRYARGEVITHPGGQQVRITRPLDWGAVTEHSDYMGLIQQISDPDSVLRKSSRVLPELLKLGIEKNPMLTFKALSGAIATGHPIETFINPEVMAPVWQQLVSAADTYYAPGEFTTFAAFEWTSTPGGNNQHRNVFFRDSSKVPEVPLTTLDTTEPQQLWAWMDTQRAKGNEVLAISHNGNLSSGRMFPTQLDQAGDPIDQRWAEARLRNEPLTEIKQGKGQSETSPTLSPNDEFANYEVFIWQLMGAQSKPQDKGSYVRQAYRDGMAMAQGQGYNPYQMGVMGGSDSHATAVPYRQENYFGMHGTADDTIEERVSGKVILDLNALWVSPAGLSAVWAEKNTRESIFDAMRRRETYATSGVRIGLRFFGGWNFDAQLLQHPDWATQAYTNGVPMGGTLPAKKADAPTFAIWASRDPDAANLDRVQVIKGWSKHGQTFEQIYDVAWAGEREADAGSGRVSAIGSTVNLSTGKYTNAIGATELKTLWTDPDFDPALRAAYYVRVLEIPTPRWSTIQAARLGQLPPGGQGYSPIIQERAWSTPIWYTPEEQVIDNGGITVAALQQEGAEALNNAELRDLVIGKTLRIHNRVSGQIVDILYGTGGQRMVLRIDGQPAGLADMGNVLHGRPAAYQIVDNTLVTNIEGDSLRIAVYKIGKQIVAARDDEFGFANYDVQVIEGEYNSDHQ